MRISPILLLVLLLPVACSDPSSGDAGPATATSELAAHEGTLDVLVHDDVDGSVRELYMLRIDRQRAYEVVLSDTVRESVEGFDSGDRLRVFGELRDDRIEAVFVEPAVKAAKDGIGTVRQANIGLGNRSAAVILVSFEGTPSPFDPEEMRQAVFGSGRSTNAFYLEGSRGQMKLVGLQDPEGGDVFGPYTVPYQNCSDAGGGDLNRGNEAIGRAAREMADADGANTAAYDHIVHYLPPINSGCSGGGVAGGSGYTWIFGVNMNGAWDYITHEVAHNFGLPHAAWYQNCTSESDGMITHGGACSHQEYGDPTDVMGRRNFMFSSFHLERLRWLDEGNVLVLDQSRRVLLSPITSSAGIQSLRVPRPGAPSADAFLPFRVPTAVG